MIRFLCIFSCAVIFSAPGLVRAQESLSDNASSAIEIIGEELAAIRQALTEQDTAPVDGGFFGHSKSEYQDDINALLDEAFETIGPSVYGETRQKLREVDEGLKLGRDQLSELEVARKLAPANSARAEPSLLDRVRGREGPKGSRVELSQRIAKMNDKISVLEGERDQVIAGFADLLKRQYDVELSAEEAEAALYQVNGGSIVESAVVFKLIGTIQQKLKDILAVDLSSDVTEKYYGVAAISRLMIVRMHEKHLADYDDKWLPKLDELYASNREEERRNRNLAKKQLSPAQQKVVDENLKTRASIASAIDQYKQILMRRKQLTESNLDAARIEADLALRTLRTLEDATMLSGLFDESSEEFSALTNLEAPDLLPLDNKEMFDRFLDLSKAMEGTS